MKAVRSIELGIDTPHLPKLEAKTDDEIRAMVADTDDERIFAIYAALERGIMTPDEIFDKMCIRDSGTTHIQAPQRPSASLRRIVSVKTPACNVTTRLILKTHAFR